MRIGILTLHAKYRFGIALQTEALQHFLEQLGHTVEVINYRCPAVMEKSRISAGEKKHTKLYGDFYRKRLHLTESCTNLSELKELPDYDLLITAGEGVFDGAACRGLKPGYFLEFAPKVPKAACAVRIAAGRAAVYETDFFRKHLNGFLAVSACDHVIRERLQECTGLTVETMRSLLLLKQTETYTENKNRLPFGLKKAVSRPYILLITEKGEYIPRRVTEKLVNMTGLPCIHNIPKMKLTGQSGNCFGLSPEAIPKLIKKAAYVITNSMDAALFSLMYGKKLLLVPTGDSTERLLTLAEDFSLERNIISRKELLESVGQTDYDVTAAAVRLTEEGRHCRMIMEQILNNI